MVSYGLTSIIIIIIGVTITMVFYLRFRSGKTPEILHNLPIVRNHLPDLTEGIADGYELKHDLKPNGTHKVTMLGRDRAYDEKEERLPKPKIITFLVPRNGRIVYPKGTWSKERDLVEYIRPDETGYQHLANTPLEQMYIKASALLKSINNITDAVDLGNQYQASHMRRINTGHVADEDMERQNRLFEEALNRVMQIQQEPEKKDKKR